MVEFGACGEDFFSVMAVLCIACMHAWTPACHPFLLLACLRAELVFPRYVSVRFPDGLVRSFVRMVVVVVVCPVPYFAH